MRLNAPTLVRLLCFLIAPPHSVTGLQSFLGWSCHLDQAVLTELEEPPAFLLGEVLSSTPLVELDGRLIVLRHDEHHARAASLYCQLEEEPEFSSTSGSDATQSLQDQ